MAYNNMMIESRSPFSTEFVYVDVPECKADDLLIRAGVHVRFYGEWVRPNCEYILVRCRVWRWEIHKFERVMEEFARKMLLTGHTDYDEYCDTLFERLQDAIDDYPLTVRTIEHLLAQTHNLTLYLKYVEEHAPELFAEMEEWFDGMAGYAKQRE